MDGASPPYSSSIDQKSLCLNSAVSYATAGSLAEEEAWTEYWDQLGRSQQLGPRTHPAYSLYTSFNAIPARAGRWSSMKALQAYQRERHRATRIRQRLLRGLLLPGQEVLFLARDAEVSTEPRQAHADLGVLPGTGACDTSSGAAVLPPPFAAVLDSGHLTDPILLCDQRSLEVGASQMTMLTQHVSPEQDAQSTAAVLVQPLIEEVLMNQLDMPLTAQCIFCGSLGTKCREWQRQRAIREAVGVTAQEALIDLKVDPRYRRPGEFVRRH